MAWITYTTVDGSERAIWTTDAERAAARLAARGMTVVAVVPLHYR